MTTVSPEDLIAASAYVKPTLDRSKRLALARLARLWGQVDAKDIRATATPVLPPIASLMHEQQAAGRQVSWSQAQLATAVSTGARPGTVTLPIDSFRDGYLPSGVSFESAVTPSIPATLARIAESMVPELAIEATGRVLASMVGSIAHDEARRVTEDVVFSMANGVAPVTGYARKAEGANTCDFCRTLITRGPVYAENTAGFRAHRFCDCTVYATSMDTFTVDPNDWAAYQRWAATQRRTVPGASTIDPATRVIGATGPDRLKVVEAQIASYEPVVNAGNGTEWMRAKLDDLQRERTALKPELNDYRIPHRAPGHEFGGSLDDLRTIYPADFYDHPEYYLDGGGNLYDKESLAAIRAAQGKPDQYVTVYRASPEGTRIQPGDWVSLSPTYAKQMGMDAVDEALDMPVHQRQVRISELFSEGNSINEFGWDPSITPPGLLRIDPTNVTLDSLPNHPFLSQEIKIPAPGTPFYNPEWQLKSQLSHSHYYYDDKSRVAVVTASHHKMDPDQLTSFNAAAKRAVDLARPNMDGDVDAVIVFDLKHPVTRYAHAQTRVGSRRSEVSRTIVRWGDPTIAARLTANDLDPFFTAAHASGHKIEAVLLHELGHMTDQVGDSARRKSWHLFDRFHGQWLDQSDDELVAAVRDFANGFRTDENIAILKRGITGGPTIYARMTPREMYAEAFSIWSLRNVVPFPPSTLEWVRHYAGAYQWT